MTDHSPITTHVLDTSLGRPASDIAVSLYFNVAGNWTLVAAEKTNEQGRCMQLLAGKTLQLGVYRLQFETTTYFSLSSRTTFFPEVSIDFQVASLDEHYHVPLLLSPFGYSTYRGS